MRKAYGSHWIMAVLVLTLLVGLLVFTATASAGSKARPFRGCAVGQVTFTFGTPEDPNDSPWGPYGMWTNTAVAGNVSHLGASLMTGRHPTPGGTDIAGGHMKLVAANGDELWMTYTGYAPLPGPSTEVVVVNVCYTICGGTGRFVDASGGGEMTGYAQFLGYDVFAWPATFVWSGGTIVY